MKGVGRATALELAGQDADLTITDVHHFSGLDIPVAVRLRLL